MPADTIRAELLGERAATTARIRTLTDEFDGIVSAWADANTDDEHDPEGATIAFERAQVAAVLNQARARLADLDAALERLSAGSYATCERCGAKVADERLRARPGVRTCIDCARSAR